MTDAGVRGYHLPSGTRGPRWGAEAAHRGSRGPPPETVGSVPDSGTTVSHVPHTVCVIQLTLGETRGSGVDFVRFRRLDEGAIELFDLGEEFADTGEQLRCEHLVGR